MYSPECEQLTAADERHIRETVRWLADRLDNQPWKHGGARIYWTISVDSIAQGRPSISVTTEGNRRSGFVLIGGTRVAYRRDMGRTLYLIAVEQLEYQKRCRFHGAQMIGD